MLVNLQKQTRMCVCSNINFLPSCYNIGKLAETNKGVYLLQHYSPSILLQCWQTCRNKQGCIPAPTLSHFQPAAMLANLQKQTRMCTCSNIILLPSCCNVAKLAETNKYVYLLQHYPPSILLQCWQNCRNKQGYVSAPALSSFYLSAMLANLHPQTRVCICSNIIRLSICCNVRKLAEIKTRMCTCSNFILLPSICNVGKLAETHKGVYLLLHYAPSILQQF